MSALMAGWLTHLLVPAVHDPTIRELPGRTFAATNNITSDSPAPHVEHDSVISFPGTVAVQLRSKEVFDLLTLEAALTLLGELRGGVGRPENDDRSSGLPAAHTSVWKS